MTVRSAMAARMRAAQFSESSGHVQAVTVVSGGETYAGISGIVTIRSEKDQSNGSHLGSSSVKEGSATLDPTEVTLVEQSAANYGTLTDADSNSFTIAEILARNAAIIKVRLRIITRTTGGNLRRQS